MTWDIVYWIGQDLHVCLHSYSILLGEKGGNLVSDSFTGGNTALLEGWVSLKVPGHTIPVYIVGFWSWLSGCFGGFGSFLK
jgi:hypothetical protein